MMLPFVKHGSTIDYLQYQRQRSGAYRLLILEAEVRGGEGRRGDGDRRETQVELLDFTKWTKEISLSLWQQHIAKCNVGPNFEIFSEGPSPIVKPIFFLCILSAIMTLGKAPGECCFQKETGYKRICRHTGKNYRRTKQPFLTLCEEGERRIKQRCQVLVSFFALIL